MPQKHRRRTRRFRLFAGAIALVVAFGFGLSFAKGMSVYLIGREDPSTRTHRELVFTTHPGVIGVEYWPSHRSHWSSESRKGPKVDGSLGYPYSCRNRLAWFFPVRVQGGSSDGPFRGWLLPMSWPLIASAGRFVWMQARSRHNQRPGGSSNCGYSLHDLNHSTCPECGHNP